MKNSLDIKTITHILKAMSISALTAFIITTSTLWVYQTVSRMLWMNAIRATNNQVFAEYPNEAPILPEYKHLKEGDRHPLTQTIIVKDNWSDQLIVTPGVRSSAFKYDPNTGILTQM